MKEGEGGKGRRGDGKTLWVCSLSPKNFLATPLVLTSSYILIIVQILDLIRGSVLPVHRASVIRTPPVLRLHLTCAPQHGPGVTGVNAIKDPMEMVSIIAQVCSFFVIFTVESYQ